MTINPKSESEDITQLLRQWRTGDSEAESKLFELLMPDLRRIAGMRFRGERPGHTLQPTALVAEAFFRLIKAKNIDWRDRGHFLAIASVMMRRLLIERARTRPDAEFVPLEGMPEGTIGRYTPRELEITVDMLLDELGRESPQQRSVVELKHYLGLTDEEAADALGLKLHTLQREWARARKWLFERLSAKP